MLWLRLRAMCDKCKRSFICWLITALAPIGYTSGGSGYDQSDELMIYAHRIAAAVEDLGGFKHDEDEEDEHYDYIRH